MTAIFSLLFLNNFLKKLSSPQICRTGEKMPAKQAVTGAFRCAGMRPGFVQCFPLLLFGRDVLIVLS